MKPMKCLKEPKANLHDLHALHGDQCIRDSGTYCGKQEKLTMKLMKTMKFFFFKSFMLFMVINVLVILELTAGSRRNLP
ncbi:MAG: hypothetical protein RB296_01005 [Acidobacteriota bacterium]|nr:hypothetical protein [Acidobacteriota bacterium]